MPELDGQVFLFDQDIWSGKMCQEHSVQTVERTLKQSLKKSSKSSKQMSPICVQLSRGGWTKSGCIYSALGEWSIAWTVHNAAEWGVPQRRVRISLVADFGGLSAPEILFERKGMRRDSAEIGETKEGIAERVAGCANSAISFQERAGKPVGGKGILIQHEHTGALSTLNNQSVFA